MVISKRVVCGLSVASVWLIAIFFLPFQVLAGLIGLSTIVCLYEFCAMLKKREYVLPFWTLTLCSIVWFVMAYLVDSHAIKNAFALEFTAITISAALCFRVMLDKRIAKPLEVTALSVCAFVYLPVMLSFIMRLAMFGFSPSNINAGIFLAFFVALIVKMSDTGGYFIGSSFGKHKLIPRLSPGKSWEGVAGGIAFSLITAVVVQLLAQQTDWEFLNFIRWFTASTEFTVYYYIAVVLVVIVGILGDLLESMFKRACGVKDSSALFPAMGGFFDTFDSLVFTPFVFYTFMKLVFFNF